MRDELIRGGNGFLEFGAAAAVERAVGIVLVELEPYGKAAGGCIAPKLDHPHFVGSEPRQADGLGTIVALRQRERASGRLG